MSAYLSIDLDYWGDYNYTKNCTRFFDKVFALNVPITFVIEHEELVPDMNRTKGLTTMYNVDYHSDIIAQPDIDKKPNDFDWANFVNRRTKADYFWFMPDACCYRENSGTCHGGGDNLFLKNIKSGWKSCKKYVGLKRIDWYKIQRVGVCLSPCFVTMDPVVPVIERLGGDSKKLEKLIAKQPFNAKKRVRGIIKRIEA